jgi:hypothetical protein
MPASASRRGVREPANGESRVKRLAGFGRYKAGIHRPTYSEEDIAGTALDRGAHGRARPQPEIDGIGNAFAGLWYGTNRRTIPVQGL